MTTDERDLTDGVCDPGLGVDWSSKTDPGPRARPRFRR
jgi:hypothetical protein